MSVIEVNNLTKDYGSGRGVFDVSFKIEKGEVFGFLGPNGAGKSTTIRHLMGFSKPDSGETKIFDKNTFDRYFEILNKVGYIPGEIALPAGLTGWEFIRMMQNLTHIHNEENLNRLLNLFKLDDVVLKGETKRMSLGVKRKLAVVTAFMSDPDVLILDEPTSGLDPVMQQVFIDFVKEEKERGKTILLSSHIFSEVDATCDRIAIIKDGKIVSEFVADDLKHKSAKFYEITFKNSKEFEEFCSNNKNSKDLKILNVDAKNNYVFISTDDSLINKVIAILSKYEIEDFNNKKETLEDYFMKFYKEEKDFGGAL
ncbi:MAG TPA: ABC transporter ATP-binding protein [Clostridiales bacterium]|nr:ABC transporter ATP-binding protein [Clostridiales bacterium]